jgi:limonene-1,2-epoxide hydrolase
MSTDTEAVVRTWFERVWNEPDGERHIAMLRHPEAVSRGLSADAISGIDPYVAFLRNVKRTLRDARVEVEQLLSDGAHVAARARLQGRVGSRAVDIEGLGIMEVRDGRIYRAWNQWDVPKLLAQLGIPVAHATLESVFTALAKDAPR